MAIRSVAQLGPGLEDVIAEGEVWYDIAGLGTIASPQLGSTETDTEGNLRIFVQASAAIAAAPTGTQITVTRPAFTAAAGAGGAFAPAATAVAEGGFFWARVPIDVTA